MSGESITAGAHFRAPSDVWRYVREGLRAARHDRGQAAQDVADELQWPLIRVLRIEQGSKRPSPEEVAVLLELYGVQQARREQILLLAEEAAARSNDGA